MQWLGSVNFPLNTTSDLLEKVSASYTPITRQQDLSLTASNFSQLRMEIT